MKIAYLVPHPLVPRLDLEFGRDEATLNWVRSLPGRSWDAERKVWRVTGVGPDPDRMFKEHGFDVIGPDGLEADLGNDVKAVAVPSDHGHYRVAVYPRLAGRDEIEGRLGPDVIWDTDHWLVTPDVVLSEGKPVDWLIVSDKIDPPRPGEEVDALVYDGTLAGLRGVPLIDLNRVDHDLAASMIACGIDNVADLVNTLPRRYLDMSNPQKINDVVLGDTAAIVGTIKSFTKPQNGKRSASAKIVDDDGTPVWVNWFHASWKVKSLRVDNRVLIHGVMTEFAPGKRSMANPLVDVLVASESDKGLLGVYPASGKNELTTWAMNFAEREAVSRLGQMVDPVPPVYTQGRGLPGRADAYRMVHTPATPEEAVKGRDRLAYDELLRLQLSIQMSRTAQYNQPGIAHEVDRHLIEQYLGKFPYPLTGAQVRACNEILSDVASPHAMNRMLVGDVSSGKTLVSIVGMLAAVEGGSQAVLIAPTDVLASQHHAEIADAMDGITHRDGRHVRVELLSRAVTGKAKKQVVADLASGAVDIVVGTHALVQDSIEFARLGLAVVDEQHRFGVEQRNALREKGDGYLPDMLYATATPIPRSAAMTVFGDLDKSVIDEMPPGRTPVRTVHSVDPLAAWEDVAAQVAGGRQAFVVCPLVTESLTREAAAAHQTAEMLGDGPLKGLRIGVVTGKQKNAERNEVMGQFERGELDVLVATTVIEVGVNVPNATVMVVLGADKFGLAQLHQLRGRVGRGQWPGSCWLVCDPTTKDGVQRIEAMVRTTSGFELAELDLQIRGVGALGGSSQSGATGLRVADVMADHQLHEWAKADAYELVKGDPTLARRPHLMAEIKDNLGEDAQAWLSKA